MEQEQEKVLSKKREINPLLYALWRRLGKFVGYPKKEGKGISSASNENISFIPNLLTEEFHLVSPVC